MTLQDLINSYRMPEPVVSLVRDTQLLLIAGIVGGGKNTVINELLRHDTFRPIVSHTTRLPRVNHGVPERDGQDYHFVTVEEAGQLVRDQAFVEVKYVHGNVYGTSASELQAARDEGKIAVTDIDIHGVMEYLSIKPDTHAIFLLPPSVETWLTRLERRYGDLETHRDEIRKRFQTAYDEITHIMQDDRFIIVINDDLATTVERIGQIVRGERDHTSDYAATVADHLLEYIRHQAGVNRG